MLLDVQGPDVLRVMLKAGDLELAAIRHAHRWVEQTIDEVLEDHRFQDGVASELAARLLDHPAVDELHASDARLDELLRRLDRGHPVDDQTEAPPPIVAEYVPSRPLYFVVELLPAAPFVGADLLERLDAVRWFQLQLELVAQLEDGAWVLPERCGWQGAAPPSYRAAKVAVAMIEEFTTRDADVLDPLWARIRQHLHGFEPRLGEPPAETGRRAKMLRSAAESAQVRIDVDRGSAAGDVRDILVQFGMWRTGQAWVRMSTQGWPWLTLIDQGSTLSVCVLPLGIEDARAALIDAFDLVDALVAATNGSAWHHFGEDRVDRRTCLASTLDAVEACIGLGIQPGTLAAADLLRMLADPDTDVRFDVTRPHELGP